MHPSSLYRWGIKFPTIVTAEHCTVTCFFWRSLSHPGKAPTDQNNPDMGRAIRGALGIVKRHFRGFQVPRKRILKCFSKTSRKGSLVGGVGGATRIACILPCSSLVCLCRTRASIYNLPITTTGLRLVEALHLARPNPTQGFEQTPTMPQTPRACVLLRRDCLQQ